ncbi:response regulator transcription factor [Variovorax sp. J22R133]|uniref:response regulator n=1 Tax=Variovorax brevis TaxID=3053503 RepID=UPI002576BBC3|nr:response regulator transcription factor [Variovorax sp. J22R133]MDM0117906.1 response regulator transcription factor [Variovorax sp. J22R133]
MDERPVTVALVEDEPEVLAVIAKVIRASPRLHLLQTSATALEMMRWLAKNPVDVLLVDLGLPDRPGTEVIRLCRSLQPKCEIMVLSTFGDAYHMLQAFEAGARGYLLKNGTEDELATHVLSLHAGGAPMSPMIASQLLSRWQEGARKPPVPAARSDRKIDALSPRELEVLQLVARGCTYSETATHLKISVTTVQAHVRNIYGKLDVHNKAEALYEARQLGLLD